MEITQGQSKESRIEHSQKKGYELRAKSSNMLAIRKKNAINQRRAQDHHQIQAAGSQ